MIEALRDDALINSLGGRFRFTSLVQHRVRELMGGARPLIDRQGRSDLELAIGEIVEGKIRSILICEATPDDPESVEETTEL